MDIKARIGLAKKTFGAMRSVFCAKRFGIELKTQLQKTSSISLHCLQFQTIPVLLTNSALAPLYHFLRFLPPFFLDLLPFFFFFILSSCCTTFSTTPRSLLIVSSFPLPSSGGFVIIHGRLKQPISNWSWHLKQYDSRGRFPWTCLANLYSATISCKIAVSPRYGWV